MLFQRTWGRLVSCNLLQINMYLGSEIQWEKLKHLLSILFLRLNFAPLPTRLPPLSTGEKGWGIWAVVTSQQLVSTAPSCSYLSPAPTWGPSHGMQFFMSFSKVSHSQMLQFFSGNIHLLHRLQALLWCLQHLLSLLLLWPWCSLGYVSFFSLSDVFMTSLKFIFLETQPIWLMASAVCCAVSPEAVGNISAQYRPAWVFLHRGHPTRIIANTWTQTPNLHSIMGKGRKNRIWVYLLI